MTMVKQKKINNKKTLLVTLGDSWTEGVGCYDPELLQEFLNKKITMNELYDSSVTKEYFFKGSWPWALSEKLDCDLINLGTGGTANSASAKNFVCNWIENCLPIVENYEKVTVIWLLSDPTRLSFYSNEKIVSLLRNDNDRLFNYYIRDVHLHPNDSMLETKFLLKSVEAVCQLNGFNFVYGSAFTDINQLNKVYNSNNNIHNFAEFNCFNTEVEKQKSKYMAHCGHPNEKGYELIADILYTILTTHFKDFIK